MPNIHDNAINRRAGKTIRLDQAAPPPPNNFPFLQWIIAPDVNESFPDRRIRTTDRDDLILMNGHNWYETLRIDGGEGFNVIQGTFGEYAKPFGNSPNQGNFAPDVKNVQWALLRTETSKVALDFLQWKDVAYVEARGLQGPSSPNRHNASDDDVLTRFVNIPLRVRQIGVCHFNGIAVFEFVTPPPHGHSSSFHPLNLYLDRNAIGGEIHINNASILHIHATGANGRQVLQADATATITVDGSGDVNLQHSSSLQTTIDASAATGSCILAALSNRSVTVKAGRGSSNEITTNGHGDRIHFLPDHLGRNTYIPLNFMLGTPTSGSGSVGGISLADDSLNALAIQITDFIPGLDRIDFRKMPVAGYAIAVTHEDLSGQPTLSAAAEYAAAHNARKGQHTITVFEYKCQNEQMTSTYAFNDQSGDQIIGFGDGLLKLVGVSSQGPTGFVTPADFN